MQRYQTKIPNQKMRKLFTLYFTRNYGSQATSLQQDDEVTPTTAKRTISKVVLHEVLSHT